MSDLDGLQLVVNFMNDSAHLRDIGAAVALCGIPVGGWFIRRFMFITQIGGKRGCPECRDIYLHRKMREKGQRHDYPCPRCGK